MPTKPIESLLYRELSMASGKESIEISSALLKELVNYGTTAFQRCQTSTKGEENEDLAALILYLHIIEMTDGIEVLLSQSCPTPSIPLIRSSFESLLSMDYILEKNYTQRSLAWLVDYVSTRLESYDYLDEDTVKGKLLAKAIADDKSVESTTNVSLPPKDMVQKAKDNLIGMLEKDQFQKIIAELKNYKRRPRWYKLFGGPNNIRELSKHLDREAQYLIFYRQWSTIVHGSDASRFIGMTKDGAGKFNNLRNPNEIKLIAMHSATLILNATKLMLGKFRPGENYASWYKREVMINYRKILNG